MRDLLEARLLSIEKVQDQHSCNFNNQPEHLEKGDQGSQRFVERKDNCKRSDKIESRLDAMDKAREISAVQNLSQTPAFVRDQVEHLQALHDTRFLTAFKHSSRCWKQATEQLDLANKTAIAAALQAQKESAGETQKSSQAAIAKSEQFNL